MAHGTLIQSFSPHLLSLNQSLDRNEGKAVKLVIGIRQRNGALLSACPTKFLRVAQQDFAPKTEL